ncbi:MAG: hypothetical protein WD696_06615 [Bryobacteraceae bacterium]
MNCPVCQARFRGARECTRCGAPLAPLMALSARAWHLRQAARQAIALGEFERARRLAARAQELHYTPNGRSLGRLSGLLANLTLGGPVS